MKQRYLKVSTTHAITLIVAVKGSDEFFDGLVRHRFWQEFVPDVRLDSCDTAPSPALTVIESDKSEVNEPLNSIYADKTTYIPVIVYVEAKLECLRQAAELYTMHGSCIQIDPSSAVAFVGAVSGLGKTSLAVAALEREHQWLFDEKFVINARGVLVGGVTKPLNDQKTKAASNNHSPKGFTIPQPLTAIIIPLVTTEKHCTAYVLDQTRRTWQLYDETTRDIRQINGRLTGYTQPLQSNDSPELATKRQKNMEQLAQVIPIYHLRGSQAAILDYVAQLH